jgi:hypothetical protein
MQMCKPYTHIIIAKIMINNVKLHSITIYKHKMDLKLSELTFKVEKCITRTFIEKKINWNTKFDYKFKYIAQNIYN